MPQPSPQFIQRLEQELRYTYRAQYQQKKSFSLAGMAKILIPAFSGLFVVTLILINFVFTAEVAAPIEAQQASSGVETVAFSEGQAEEELINSFDNEELNQIYNGVQLAAASN